MTPLVHLENVTRRFGDITALDEIVDSRAEDD